MTLALSTRLGQAPAQPSTTFFRSPRVAVGSFRCPVDHPNFRHEGEMGGFEMVFPRSAVWIRRPDCRSFVADANLVTLYNRGQVYERAPIASSGDNCDWYSLDEALAREIVAERDREAADSPTPLRFPFAAGSPELYLRQRRLFERLRRGARPTASGPGELDALAVEEEVGQLFAAVVARSYAGRRSENAPPARPEPEAVRRARELLAARFREALNLSELARECGLSSFRLAHLFRRETGSSLHAWRVRLRLQAALDELSDSPRPDLTELALDLGFSSHSHFSASFRRCFGVTPSAMRARRATTFEASKFAIARRTAHG
ncbi:MAG: AraC family transcriptional regulator [Thermoanaerobaculia bacterium]